VIIVLTHESSAMNLTENRMHIEITRGTAGWTKQPCSSSSSADFSGRNFGQYGLFDSLCEQKPVQDKCQS
jgi:hypothetical protein